MRRHTNMFETRAEQRNCSVPYLTMFVDIRSFCLHRIPVVASRDGVEFSNESISKISHRFLLCIYNQKHRMADENDRI